MTKELRDHLITTCGLKDDVKDGVLEMIYPRTIAAYEAGYEQAKKDLSCVQQRLNVLEDHNMTIDNVIFCLEEHNEIHSRQEPRAYYITKALNIAIDFLKNHKWHYPSKGDYPPSTGKYCGRSEPVLVWLGDNNVEYAQWIEESKTWGRGICELTGTVIAWRYIELPKERI